MPPHSHPGAPHGLWPHRDAADGPGHGPAGGPGGPRPPGRRDRPHPRLPRRAGEGPGRGGPLGGEPPGGLRGRRGRRGQLQPGHDRGRRRLRRHRGDHGGDQHGRRGHQLLRHRGPEAALHPRAHPRRVRRRRLRPLRAQGRIRRRGPDHQGGEAGRQVGPQRGEDVDLLRGPGRGLRGLGAHRGGGAQGRERLSGPRRDQGPHPRQARGEDGAAGQPHHQRRLRRLRGPRGRAPRRARGRASRSP